MNRRVAAGMLLLASLLAGAGCAGHRTLDRQELQDMVWPAGDPRVRLQYVISPDPKSSSSKLLRFLGEQESAAIFRRPYGVAWDGDDLLVADPDARRMVRIDPRGRTTVTDPDLFVQPIGVAACPQGIIVTDSEAGSVAVLDRELHWVRWLAEDLARPTGVACDEDRVYLSETAEHRVLIFERDGSRRTLGRRGAEPGEFNFPTSIAVHRTELLVADAMNFRVQRFDAQSGEFRGSFGELGDAAGEMPRLKGIGVDAVGHLWISDGYLDQVSLYDLDGTFLLGIGGHGFDPGQFAFPAGVAANDNGEVAVVDSLNRRLQVFRVLDERLDSVAEPGKE